MMNWRNVCFGLSLFWILCSSEYKEKPVKNSEKVCPETDFLESGRHCDERVNTPMTWSDARQYCWDRGGYLINKLEHDVNIIPRDMIGEWISLHVLNGKLWWDDLEPEPAEIKELYYIWNQKPKNLSEDSYGVVVDIDGGDTHSKEYQPSKFTIEMVSGPQKKPFTCFKKTMSYYPDADDEKCQDGFVSHWQWDHCKKFIMELKNYTQAQSYCTSSKSSLWTPINENFDHEIQFVTTDSIHIRRPDRKITFNHTAGGCFYIIPKSEIITGTIMTGNCSVARSFICEKPAKHYSSKPNVNLSIENLPTDAIKLSDHTILVNSSSCGSIIVKCSNPSQPSMFIKDGNYRNILNHQTFSQYLVNSYVKIKDKYTPQGTYTCDVLFGKYGRVLSNNVTFIFNDVLTTWFYLVIEVDMDIDFSQYVMVDSHKDEFVNILRLKDSYQIQGEEVLIYPDSIVKSTHERQELQGKSINLVTIKFAIHKNMSRNSNLTYSYRFDKSNEKQSQLIYFDSYLKEIKAYFGKKLISNVAAVNQFLKFFSTSGIPSRRKRNIRLKRHDNNSESENLYNGSYVKDTRICQADSIETNEGPIRFEIAMAGEYLNSTSICANTKLSPLALGRCNGDFQNGYSWEIVRFYNCYHERRLYSGITDYLLDTLNTMGNVLEEKTIHEIYNVSHRYREMTIADVRLIAEIVLSSTISLKDFNAKNGRTLSSIVANTMEAQIDNALNSEDYKNSKYRLLKSLEAVTSNVRLSSAQETWSTKNFAIRIDEGSKQSGSFGLAISDEADSDQYIEGHEVEEREDILAGIIIPPEVFDELPLRKDRQRTNFIIYKSTALFIGRNNHIGEVVNPISFVIGGILKDVHVTNLTHRIKLRFKIDNTTKSPTCAFLQEDFEVVRWSIDGVKLESYDNNSGLIECSSNHLTNFAVLAGFEGGPGSRLGKILSYISLTGMIISIICLSLVICTQLFFKLASI